MLLMDERTHRHRATARIVDELMALKAESAGSAEGRTRGREDRRIGQGLRERYEVPTELPPKLLALIGKLDDSDLLFPAFSWRNDVDFFP
jgi:hypothetical protein